MVTLPGTHSPRESCGLLPHSLQEMSPAQAILAKTAASSPEGSQLQGRRALDCVVHLHILVSKIVPGTQQTLSRRLLVDGRTQSVKQEHNRLCPAGRTKPATGTPPRLLRVPQPFQGIFRSVGGFSTASSLHPPSKGSSSQRSLWSGGVARMSPPTTRTNYRSWLDT